MEWRSFDGYDHQLEYWCWKQLITKSIFDLLYITKECSTVAVDAGRTIAMVSRTLMLWKVTHFASLLRNSVASSFNDKLFSSSWSIWKLSTHVLSQSYRHLLELRGRFPHNQSQLSPHRILGVSPILQCHIVQFLDICWAFLWFEDAESSQETQGIFETTADLPADLFQVGLKHILVEIFSSRSTTPIARSVTVS